MNQYPVSQAPNSPNNTDEAVMNNFEAENNDAPLDNDGMPPPSIDEMFSNIEDSDEAASSSVGSPDVTYGDYDIPGGMTKRADIGTLGEPVKPGTPEEFVVNTRDRLSIYNKLIFDHRLQHIRKEQAIKLAKQIFQYEYEIIVQRLTLSLDIEKKRTFIQYMNASKDLQKALLQVVGRAVEDLGDTLFDVRRDLILSFGRRYRELDTMVEKGHLTAQQGAHERGILDAERNSALAEVLKRARQLHLNNSKLLEQTLVLLRDDMLSKGLL